MTWPGSLPEEDGPRQPRTPARPPASARASPGRLQEAPRRPGRCAHPCGAGPGGGGSGEEGLKGARLAPGPSRAPGLPLRRAQGWRPAGVLAAGAAAAAALAPAGGGDLALAPGVRRQDGGGAPEAGLLLFFAVLRPAVRRLRLGLLLLVRCLLLLLQQP